MGSYGMGEVCVWESLHMSSHWVSGYGNDVLMEEWNGTWLISWTTLSGWISRKQFLWCYSQYLQELRPSFPGCNSQWRCCLEQTLCKHRQPRLHSPDYIAVMERDKVCEGPLFPGHLSKWVMQRLWYLQWCSPGRWSSQASGPAGWAGLVRRPLDLFGEPEPGEGSPQILLACVGRTCYSPMPGLMQLQGSLLVPRVPLQI